MQQLKKEDQPSRRAAQNCATTSRVGAKSLDQAPRDDWWVRSVHSKKAGRENSAPKSLNVAGVRLYSQLFSSNIVPI